MMEYTIAKILVNDFSDEKAEIICAVLGGLGYEGFEIKEDGLSAYIDTSMFDSNIAMETLSNLPLELDFSLTSEVLKNENWNETWEKNFYQPVVIGNEVLVKSSFHKTDLKANYQIIIDPKMSFGTGHHETTSTVLEALVSHDIKGKSIIDIGTGTGILAFYCSMRGATKIVATDFDPICIENGAENQELNNLENIEWLLGDRKIIEPMNSTYDIVIANINRNILLQDMDQFSRLLDANGTLFLSGFYKDDVPILERAAQEQGLKISKEHSKNNWMCLELVKA